MKQQLEFQDALEILKKKAKTASLEEMEVILDLEYEMNSICQEHGSKKQRVEVRNCFSDIRLQYVYKLMDTF